MKNKNIVYGILAVLIIILGIYFIYNKESKKNQNSTTENKTEVKTEVKNKTEVKTEVKNKTEVEKVETKINNKVKKEVNHVETKKEKEKQSDKLTTETKVTKKENLVSKEKVVKKEKKENVVGNNKFVKITPELLETELKKPWKDRISIYKNNPNLDYNMELKVPKKWSHLDYSKLGNPPEVELPEKEIQKREKYWKEGSLKKLIKVIQEQDGPNRYLTRYFTKEREAKVLRFFVNDRQKIKDIINKARKDKTQPIEVINLKEKSLNSKIDDINKIIYIDEKTGRKELVNVQHEMGISSDDLGIGIIARLLYSIIDDYISTENIDINAKKYIQYLQSI